MVQNPAKYLTISSTVDRPPYMYVHTADMIYITANAFTLFHSSKGGGDGTRNAAIHQQRQ